MSLPYVVSPLTSPRQSGTFSIVSPLSSPKESMPRSASQDLLSTPSSPAQLLLPTRYLPRSTSSERANSDHLSTQVPSPTIIKDKLTDLAPLSSPAISLALLEGLLPEDNLTGSTSSKPADSARLSTPLSAPAIVEKSTDSAFLRCSALSLALLESSLPEDNLPGSTSPKKPATFSRLSSPFSELAIGASGNPLLPPVPRSSILAPGINVFGEELSVYDVNPVPKFGTIPIVFTSNPSPLPLPYETANSSSESPACLRKLYNRPQGIKVARTAAGLPAIHYNSLFPPAKTSKDRLINIDLGSMRIPVYDSEVAHEVSATNYSPGVRGNGGRRVEYRDGSGCDGTYKCNNECL